MDPTEFLKVLTSHNSSTRTIDTEDVTHQSSFSSGDESFMVASASLDFDLHQIDCADEGNHTVSVTQHRSGYDYRGNESTDSFMLEDSFALGESFNFGGADEGISSASLLMGEMGPPLCRVPRERPDLSTVLDIEEDEEDEMIDIDEDYGGEEKDDGRVEDAGLCLYGFQSVKRQT